MCKLVQAVPKENMTRTGQSLLVLQPPPPLPAGTRLSAQAAAIMGMSVVGGGGKKRAKDANARSKSPVPDNTKPRRVSRTIPKTWPWEQQRNSSRGPSNEEGAGNLAATHDEADLEISVPGAMTHAQFVRSVNTYDKMKKEESLKTGGKQDLTG